MSTSFVGEVRLVGFNFAPFGWNFCNGALVPISQNETLFNLIGTTYGGDGQQTFGLPNLQGRTAVHQGPLAGGGTYVIGQSGGVESVTIVSSSYPQHTHSLFASGNQGGSNSPGNNVMAKFNNVYETATPANAMLPATVGSSGGGNQPHNNLQPYQVLNWIISLYGIYPSPN